MLATTSYRTHHSQRRWRPAETTRWLLRWIPCSAVFKNLVNYSCHLTICRQNAFAVNLAYNVAKQKIPVGVFWYEMSIDQVCGPLYCFGG